MELIYAPDEDLYRLGNSTSPRLDKIRPEDLDLYSRNGVAVVRANGKGISLISSQRLKRIERVASGYVWRLVAHCPIPHGLALHGDLDSVMKPGGPPEHYFLCPVSDMSLNEYMGLLSELSPSLERTRKL